MQDLAEETHRKSDYIGLVILVSALWLSEALKDSGWLQQEMSQSQSVQYAMGGANWRDGERQAFFFWCLVQWWRQADEVSWARSRLGNV